MGFFRYSTLVFYLDIVLQPRQANAAAQRERAEAEQAHKVAKKEREEANNARLKATKERAEANQARQEPHLYERGSELSGSPR